jgi:hypothetical protein
MYAVHPDMRQWDAGLIWGVLWYKVFLLMKWFLRCYNAARRGHPTLVMPHRQVTATLAILSIESVIVSSIGGFVVGAICATTIPTQLQRLHPQKRLQILARSMVAWSPNLHMLLKMPSRQLSPWHMRYHLSYFHGSPYHLEPLKTTSSSLALLLYLHSRGSATTSTDLW